jgi:hypothetical protein
VVDFWTRPWRDQFSAFARHEGFKSDIIPIFVLCFYMQGRGATLQRTIRQPVLSLWRPKLTYVLYWTSR